MQLDALSNMAFNKSLTICANSWPSALCLGGSGAAKSTDRYFSDRNTLLKPFLGSTWRWRVTSRCSSSARSKRSQNARAAVEVPQLKTHDPIPPLSTVLRDLSPPLGPSSYSDAADSFLTNLATSWCLTPKPMMLLNAVKPASIDVCAHVYPRATSAERLAAVILVAWLWYLIDDICFDSSSSHGAVLAEEFGVDIAIRHDRVQMESFWARLGKLFRSTELPFESVPIDRAVWDAGRLVRNVSPSASWFDGFVESFRGHVSASCDLHFNGWSQFRSDDELEAYIDLRAGNAGMGPICYAVPMVTEKYLSIEARNHPQIQRLERICSRYCALQNDLCSYHMEVFSDKIAAYNILQVLMETRSLSFQQAMQNVMDIMTADTRKFLEIERDLQVAGLTSADDGLRDYILGLKDIMSGAYGYHISSNRYVSVGNPFPEFRSPSDATGA